MTLRRLSNLSALSVSSCPAISPTVLAEFQSRRARPSDAGDGAAAAAPPAAPLCAAVA
jgi:hypothetical protein